ncbi:MAG TPA: Ppx/GppA phosphatase family protein [Terriglobales bacterium]|nr:Ppx/GppA phosphatase family protein [Terriglobales bacterium]
MPVLAAIDIGSNSVRLKVARLSRRRLQTIYEDREVTRLGESVFKTGLLAPDAMARTVKVLRRFHKSIQEQGAAVVRAVATSALRDARNSESFIEWVESSTGWRLETISGLEEARLIHLGILANMRRLRSPLLLIDLGGGSCELTVSQQGHIRSTVSLPLGAVRLTEEFLRHDPPKKDELRSLHRLIAERLTPAAHRIARVGVRTVIATSGTAAALDAINKAEAGGKRSATPVPRKTVVKLAEMLAKRNHQQRASIPGLGTKRAEIIVAGAAVYAEIMERCNLSAFVYSPLGLRDGILAQMAAERHLSARSTRQIAADRWDSLLTAGKRYHVDLLHARQVRELAMRLFEELDEVHQLPEDYREWLSAAAMLHEVGSYINRTGWHRHAYYIIAHSEILGYTPQQRLIIAAIARYLGALLPAPGQPYLKPMPPSDRKQVPKAVALLRLARALNQGRSGAVRDVAARVKDGRVVLQLRAIRRMGADLELWMLEKERGYFRDTFGRDLFAELG